MDFAKKLLNKYGWKEGDGLGKHSDGISKPLKANYKFDKTGLGADLAVSDFNNHWWERVYNEAAQNVEVKEQQNGAVCMDLKDQEDAVEISTKGYSMKKLKKAKRSAVGSAARYENFMQSATLTKTGDEIENPNKINEIDIAVTRFTVLTDEELFRACGGRTAHKGARHGLKLSGKLARLEQQEQELLAKMVTNKVEKTAIREVEPSDLKKAKRKRKIDRQSDISNPEQVEETKDEKEEIEDAEKVADLEVKKPKKKKKNKM